MEGGGRREGKGEGQKEDQKDEEGFLKRKRAENRQVVGFRGVVNGRWAWARETVDIHSRWQQGFADDTTTGSRQVQVDAEKDRRKGLEMNGGETYN